MELELVWVQVQDLVMERREVWVWVLTGQPLPRVGLLQAKRMPRHQALAEQQHTTTQTYAPQPTEAVTTVLHPVAPAAAATHTLHIATSQSAPACTASRLCVACLPPSPQQARSGGGNA